MAMAMAMAMAIKADQRVHPVRNRFWYDGYR